MVIEFVAYWVAVGKIPASSTQYSKVIHVLIFKIVTI